jgi:hypothetical protein
VICGVTAMRHSPLQQIYIFEVVLQADLQLTEIVVQTESLKLNLKNDHLNAF